MALTTFSFQSRLLDMLVRPVRLNL